jgi:hypothetical protein
MLFLNWTRAAILYEDDYGLIRYVSLILVFFKEQIQGTTNFFVRLTLILKNNFEN